MANIYCPPPTSSGGSSNKWVKGTDFPTQYFLNPKIPGTYFKVYLIADGVVVYEPIDKSQLPVPSPVAIPESIADKFKELISKLRQNPNNTDAVIASFLHDNPQVATYLKTAAIGIAVSTLVEDILSAGIGIADDPATLTLAYRIYRFANK